MEKRARIQSEAPVVVSLVVLATVLPFATAVGVLAAGGTVTILLTVIALRRRMVAASSIGVLLASVLLLGVLGLGPQQVLFSLAFVVYGLVIARLPWLREAARWRRPGSCSLRQGVMGVTVGLGPGLALWV